MNMPVKMPKPQWIDREKAQASAVELRLWAALEEVEDPEYPVSVVDMGLIYAIRHSAENKTADIDLTFTSMGCPCMEYIIDDVRERLLREDDVSAVNLQIVWDPPWTRKRLTEKGKAKLMSWGVSV